MSQEQNNSSASSALAKFMNQLNVPSLLAILLFGGGNLFETKSGNEEVQRAIRQISHLHDALSGFESRQKETLEKASRALEAQSQALRNQAQLLDNQQQILNSMRRWQQNYGNPTQ